MVEGIPKISVLVICYKQENLISRALDSLLSQIDYLYEICVSDDCSPDNTWNVLLEYQKRYPDLIKLHRNDPNVGIFENIEYTWTMPTGDIVYSLSGDDECGEDWLKTIVDYIISNKIDYKNEYFAIYGDYECRYPSGDSFVFSNKAVSLGLDPVRLSIRGIIGNRSAVCSRKVIENYKNVSVGKSHVAESAQDRQLPLFAKTVYYIPYIGNIYYARIGVSVHINNEQSRERENVEPYAMKMLIENGYLVKKSDAAYMLLKSEKAKFHRVKSFGQFLKIIKLTFESFDPVFSPKAFRIKRYLFALLVRLPHKRKVHIKI